MLWSRLWKTHYFIWTYFHQSSVSKKIKQLYTYTTYLLLFSTNCCFLVTTVKCMRKTATGCVIYAHRLDLQSYYWTKQVCLEWMKLTLLTFSLPHSKTMLACLVFNSKCQVLNFPHSKIIHDIFQVQTSWPSVESTVKQLNLSSDVGERTQISYEFHFTEGFLACSRLRAGNTQVSRNAL